MPPPEAANPVPADTVARADALMRRREWAAAAALFATLPEAGRDVGVEMKRRLAANLAALQRHRPGVYETLVALPAQQQFAVGATPSGRPTVHCRRLDDSVVSLSGGPDPLAAAAAALPQLYARSRNGEAIALCGVGDGYLVQLLAQRPPPLFMDKQQPVFLIEPEPHVVLQCLMIHDFTGAAGPAEDPRFHWFVGQEWGDQLEQALFDDPFLAPPTVTVGQGFDTQRIEARLRATVQRLVDRDADTQARVEAHYAELTPAQFTETFRQAGTRPPRVLLLTTRFSTVLQYSTRDTAAAFERLGWEARVVMEPTPHHRVLRGAIAGVVDAFKPDLVFQIDHLRHEHRGLFPANLPFACWIQDHLPHLASPEVGRRVGELDFVLTDAIATYADKFDYPPRQCIPLPKLVVRSEPADAREADAHAFSPSPGTPGEGRGEGPLTHSAQNPHPRPLPGCRERELDADADDVVFVSNASGTADALVADALTRHARDPQTRELITRTCAAIAETYERGESLPAYGDVCGVLRRTLAELGLGLAPEGFDVLARWLTHPFNDALYRQQALRWAADAAAESGLRLGLYGKGWENHPEFGPFARGPVAYGEPLRQLTRRSRINLQIVPYLCLHQRLLDGLMAGGFFLIRTHPSDVAPAALLRFLESHAGPAARTTEAAVAAVPPARQAELNRLIEKSRPCLCTTGNEDVVAMVRAWEEAGQLTVDDGPLPMLAEVGFHDRATLSERFRRFSRPDSPRQTIAAAQRRSVGDRLSYDAGIRRVVARMADLLGETAAQGGNEVVGDEVVSMTGRAPARAA